jgi:hypothetical protein
MIIAIVKRRIFFIANYTYFVKENACKPIDLQARFVENPDVLGSGRFQLLL